MFKFLTGDILESDAECLVNTVNCEGFMGKGIAYQFKLRFPENNKDYVRACKNGQLKIGSIHTFREDGKVIVNFPTKNKWRENSKIEYIHIGLMELKKIISSLGIKSIAIPPLGCGNGGLRWAEVKPIILNHLKPLVNDLDIFIYEPAGKYYKPKSIREPKKLTNAHLILMLFKSKLNKFTKLRLQKAAYFLNIYLGQEYFKFEKHKLGPYAHSIDIIIKDIKEFQTYYKLETVAAFSLAKTRLISESVEKKLTEFQKYIDLSSNFVNSIPTDKELELLATICSIIQNGENISKDVIISEIKNWSTEKASKFHESEIIHALHNLTDHRIVQQDLLGHYSITKSIIKETYLN